MIRQNVMLIQEVVNVSVRRCDGGTSKLTVGTLYDTWTQIVFISRSNSGAHRKGLDDCEEKYVKYLENDSG